MLEATVKTDTRDPMGIPEEIEKHRTKAQETLGEHVGLVRTTNSSVPDPDDANKHIYTVESVWKQVDPPGDDDEA